MPRAVLLAVAVAVVLVMPGAGLDGGVGESTAKAASPPNIVFVMADDLDERSMNSLGGIRSLMGANGATFNNAYVTYSLCCPSRASILRGQYPHNHQILHNSPPLGGEAKFRSLGRDQSTVATWLDGAGYRTAYIGKYMNGYGGAYVPPGWDEWYVLQGDPADSKVNDDGVSVTFAGNSTDRFAEEAAGFIRRSSAGQAPFFALIGTRAPHSPPEVAARHQDAFSTTSLPRPPNFDEADLSDKPLWLKDRAALTQAEIDAMTNLHRNRLRSMLAVEDLLRRVMGALRDTGELQNTYVFFTSDNGFHMGNHRLRPAKTTPYEEDTGVPLMVRGPGVPAGATRNQLVINNDLAPTIARLAGATTPAFVDGRSFAPLLTASPPSSWRTAFLEEGWKPEAGLGLQIPTHKSVHTRTHVYTEYDTAEQELYDLVADPYQLQSRPQAGNEQTYANLSGRLSKLRACAGDACRAAEGP
jgi:arylsulfatase A-like enzyme